ncbi:hypothetical protein HDV00_010865 [Rhizophlyctis rosea]|nr:hypothetical protein HDV00_010865 [Rhizophlyctis rosea]
MPQLEIPINQLYPQDPSNKGGGLEPASTHTDWVLIELQGVLETDGHRDGEQSGMQGLMLGRVNCDGKGTAYLYIGHHRLEGKRVELPKPFAVLRKRPTPPPSPSLPTTTPDHMQQPRHLPPQLPNTTTTSPTDPELPPPPPLSLHLTLSIDPDGDTTMLPAVDESPSVQYNATGGLVGDALQTLSPTNDSVPPPATSAYDVVTVIRYKYIFKSRPEHVLSKQNRGMSTFSKGR